MFSQEEAACFSSHHTKYQLHNSFNFGRCVVRDKQCTTVSKRHETEFIDDILQENQIVLNKWQEDTTSRVCYHNENKSKLKNSG